MKAGQRDKHGRFPKKTVFHLVDERLAKMEERMQEQEGSDPASRKNRRPVLRSKNPREKTVTPLYVGTDKLMTASLTKAQSHMFRI